MSHELRTPLNAVIGYSELLAEDLEDARPDVLPDLGRILCSSRHLLAMINDILDLTKVESGAWEFHYDVVNVDATVRDVAQTLEPLCRENGNQLQVEVEPGLPLIYCDQTRLLQILVNLGSNAAKFTENGHVSIRTARHRQEGGTDSLVFEVEDTGVGIAADKLHDIFDKFVQADASTTRRHPGTGLGLAICREMAQALGGQVHARSVLGEGSTFTLSLPWDRIEVPPPGEAAA